MAASAWGPQGTLYEDGVVTVEEEGEERVFPRGQMDAPVFEWRAMVFQVHPKYGRGEVLAQDRLVLARPVNPASFPEVSLVGACGDTRFYVRGDDRCVKIARGDYMFLMEQDCIGIELVDCSETALAGLDRLLEESTNFLVEGDPDALLRTEDFSKEAREEMYGTDPTSRAMMKMSGWLCHGILKLGSSTTKTVHAYGQRQVEQVEESSGDIDEKHAKRAAKVRSLAKMSNEMATKLSNKISSVMGDRMVKHVEVKTDDGTVKRHVRQAAAASMISWAEVSDSFAQAYTEAIIEGKEQSQLYMEKKYGENAKHTARDAVGAAADMGHAALTTRRIISVRKVIKKNAKYFAKNQAKEYAGVKH